MVEIKNVDILNMFSYTTYFSQCGRLKQLSTHEQLPEKHLLLLYWLRQSLCVDHNKLWKILKEMEIPDCLTCLLRNLYAGQETIVRTGQGITDWFQIGKGVYQGGILTLCLFNLYTEYIMWNASLDEVYTGIKISRRNINNLKYADDTTLMAENEEELKSLLMKMKEESEKSWHKTQHSEK